MRSSRDSHLLRAHDQKLTSRHFMTRRTGLVAFSVLVALAGVVTFGPWRDGFPTRLADKSAAAPSAARPLTVSTQTVALAGPDFLTQEFTGIVAARRTTQLAAKALGRVELLTVDLGDRVVAGQILIRLDREQLEAERNGVAANMAAAQARLAELKNGPRPQDIDQGESRVRELRSLTELQQSNQNRTENLRNSAAVSAQELDENNFRTEAVEAQLRSAEKALELLKEGTREEQLAAQAAVIESLAAQLKSIEIQLDDQQIVAPYDGHIQSRLVDEGTIVAAGQPLLEIVETGTLEVRLGVPPELTNNLADEQVSVALNGVTLPAKISRIAPAVQLATRTREIVLELGQASYRNVAVGQAVDVRLKTRLDSQGYWIPAAALTAGARGLWAVFVTVPTPTDSSPADQATHLVERRQVELLRSQNVWAEVRGPITPADQIVVDGVHRIVAGQRVLIAEKE